MCSYLCQTLPIVCLQQKLAKLQKHLNAIICEQTSGGRVEVHGDILAMHMLKEAQSLEKFTRLFTELYDTHCTDYKCLQTFQGVITVCKFMCLLLSLSLHYFPLFVHISRNHTLLGQISLTCFIRKTRTLTFVNYTCKYRGLLWQQ